MYAVAGYPVYHSLSPELFASMGTPYTRIAAYNAKDLYDIIIRHNFEGINITAPFKKSFIPFLDKIDETVKRTNSVNTVKISDGILTGYNTDYYAVYDFLKQYSGKSLFLIGAGGSACNIMLACNQLNIELNVYNRTKSKLNDLSGDYSFNVIEKSNIEYAISKSDIIFNTAPQLNEDIIEIIRKSTVENQIIADAVYHCSPLKISDRKIKFSGKDWLIAQGKSAFEIFTGNISDKIIPELHRNKPGNYILTGFMGSGKTSVGKSLANKLNCKFIDTDSLIENKYGISVSEIFNSSGEEYFRKIETEILETINTNNNIVATGGGTVIKNAEKLKQLGEIIYLHSDLDICLNRVRLSDRPLLKNKNLKELYEYRKNLYFRNCDLIINSAYSLEIITKRLYEEINYAVANRR